MAKKIIPAFTISSITARAFWHARQNLVPEMRPSGLADDASAHDVIAQTGWARTLGGIDVYLGLRARRPETKRRDLEEAVHRGDLRVIPAVRGCIYLVPRRDVTPLMALAAELQRPRTSRDLDKAGSSWEEVEEIADAALEALANGPLSTTAIRKALPSGLVRSLGDAGKKVGLSSPLPTALRELEFRTKITRRPIGDRLDTERYDWHLVEEMEAPAMRVAEIEYLSLIVERFLSFFAPATTKEIATWIGVPQRDVKVVLEDLPLLPVQVDGWKDLAWILEDHAEALREAKPSLELSFLPFEDLLLVVHGGPRLFADPVHHDLPVGSWGGAKSTILGEAKHLSKRPLMLGPDLVGFWEVDLEADELVVGTFEPLAPGILADLEQKRADLLSFVRDELGHGRSFSLDTDEKVLQRAQEVRALQI